MRRPRARTAVSLLAGAMALMVAGYALYRFAGSDETPPVAAGAGIANPAQLIAAPGRVEPLSEEIRVGAAVAGRLVEVRVEEGEDVRKDQVLAVLENDYLRARVAQAAADIHAKEAELARVVNGARPEERREAAAVVDEAVALLALAKADRDRQLALAASGSISRAQLDRAEREYEAAAARLASARERLHVITAPAREEDLAQAQANLALATARLDEAKDLYEKTFVRSPIAGRILRKHKHVGEKVAETLETVIFTVGDVSRLRVRAEVDERDIANVKEGLPAFVTADAFGTRRFPGRVVRVGQLLGRKNIRTDEPTERVDTKVLETLIELEPDAPLVPGLRVDVYIERP